jgi:hypothetical protein
VAHSARWAPIVARQAGLHLRPSGLSSRCIQREGIRPSLRRTPCRATAQPARRHQRRRRRPGPALGCASAPEASSLSRKVNAWPGGLLPREGATRATRRGAPARWTPLVARPWPWRAWVRPASSRAHQHLQQNAHGTKAGSQQDKARHRGGSPRDATRRD